MTIASAVAAFEAKFQVDETWVVTQLNKAWTEVQVVESWVDNEANTIASWINAHETDINAALSGVEALVPEAAPELAAAGVALEATAAASAALAAGLKAGTTPVSTLTNAYIAVKSAASEVNAVLAVAAAPTPTPAS